MYINGVIHGMKDHRQDGTAYALVRVYYKNKTSPDLKKYVSYLEGISFFSFYNSLGTYN